MTNEETITKSRQGNLICATCLKELENTSLISMAVNKDQVSKMLVYLSFEKKSLLTFTTPFTEI